MAASTSIQPDHRTDPLGNNDTAAESAPMSRKEKRKALKKKKRKQMRIEIATRERVEEEARMNDPEELAREREMEREEAERMERERKEFEERERRLMEEFEMKRKRDEEAEAERRRRIEVEEEEEERKLNETGNENPNDLINEDEWEYVEEGPAEIIWQGNEIIVKKKKVRVPKKNVDQADMKEDTSRPISNPLAPQSEAFEDFKSAQELLDSVAQQVPNFGTEQDKAHCPFHLKTGACRFGTRCSRVHFYPDKSCTLLVKNMYNGPGLAWEQDEGLEIPGMVVYEEVARSFEEFYEDVHTEFLKFGEIVNFKVCNNGSSHLRGNVYVHYKSMESAVLAYHSINGRYFAGKQITCEFINVTRWKIAICGEYMKSRLKNCSRGSACNFIHCFRNPGGDYEWADWDKPPPRYWVQRMEALFGHTNEYDEQHDKKSHGHKRWSSKRMHSDADSSVFRKRTSRSKERDRSHHCEDDDERTNHRRRERSGGRREETGLAHKETASSNTYYHDRMDITDFDGDSFDGSSKRVHSYRKSTSRKNQRDREQKEGDKDISTESESDMERERDRYDKHKRRRPESVRDHWDKVHNHNTTSSPSHTRDNRHRSTGRGDHVSDTDTHEKEHERNAKKQHNHGSKSSRKLNDDAGLVFHGSCGEGSKEENERHEPNKKNRPVSSEKDYLEPKLAGDGDRNRKHESRSSRKRHNDYSEAVSHANMLMDEDRSSRTRRHRDKARQHRERRSRNGCHVDDPTGDHRENGETRSSACGDYQEVERWEKESVDNEQAYRAAALRKLEEKRRTKLDSGTAANEMLEASGRVDDVPSVQHPMEPVETGDVVTPSSRKRLRI